MMSSARARRKRDVFRKRGVGVTPKFVVGHKVMGDFLPAKAGWYKRLLVWYQGVVNKWLQR